MFRGRNEGILSSALKVGDELPGTMHPCEGMIGQQFGIQNQNRAADKWLSEVVRWTWKVKLYTHLETDLLGELRDNAETEAINVFAHNLHDLLLAAPARSEEHTSELQSLMRLSYAVFCLKNKKTTKNTLGESSANI